MNLSNNFKPVIYSFCTLVFLTSCGGGGGGGSAPAPEPSPTSSLSSSSSSVILDTAVTLTWSSTNATSCSASGTWTGTKATSGTEDVTIATPGNNQFTITCSGAGVSRAASVTVEGYRNTEGVSVDGYIRQADIFIDTNDSYTADSGEDTTTSDNDGKFTIKYSDGNLISLGGTDLDSGNALDNLLIVHKLTGHSDFKAVTPVTSVAAFMADASLVNAALGIDSSLDISVVDPVAGKGDGGINDYLYEKGNQLTVLAYALQNITNNLNTTTETTQDYFRAIAEEVDAEYTSTTIKVDIETEAFITKVIDNIINAKSLTISDDNKANTISALTSTLPILEVKSTNALTTAVFDFATSTLQTDIQAIANGTASADTVTSYQADILNYVATDQNVDADEIAPNISAIGESVTTNEDTDIEIDVLANDSYLTSAPISITAENGLYGTTTISNNLVTFSPNKDFNGTDSFDYTIVQGDKISSASVTLEITSVNDTPTFNNLLSTYTVDENQNSVTTISATDVEDESLTISISGTDETSFNLSSSNVLTFAESPDYETKNSYTINISVTDGIDTLEKTITISINNLNDNAPIFTSSNFSVEENQLAIGFITANDADSDSLVFSLDGTAPSTNCSSNVCISLNSNTGLLSFGVSGDVAPDYEAITSYSFNIIVSDGLNLSTQNLTVNILNVNDVFPVIETSAFDPEENQKTIGSIAASDIEGDLLSYSISGTDAELINLNEKTLSFKSYPDFETKNLYSITVSVFDGLNTTSKDINLNVQDIWNEYSFAGGRYYAPETTYNITSPDTGQVFSYNYDAGWYCEDKTPDQAALESEDYLYCPTLNLALYKMNKPYHPFSESFVEGEHYLTPMSRLDNTNEINWTLSFWIKPNEPECVPRHCSTANNPYVPVGSSEIMRGRNDKAYVAGNGYTQEDLQFWMYKGPNNELYFTIRDSLQNRTSQSELKSSQKYQVSTKDNVLSQNKWSHVLLRCKVTPTIFDTECEFFIDGESGIDIPKRGRDYRGTGFTGGDSRELRWNLIGFSGANHNLDDFSLWTGLASDTEATSIYNSGMPKNLKDFTIQSNKPSIYYRFEKEHLGTHEWTNGPSVGGGTIANAAYDIDTDLDRDQLDVITEYIDAQKNIIRDTPLNNILETITVSVVANSNGDGNVYVIDGVEKKSITLELGKTYILNHPPAHPMMFSEIADGTHGGGQDFRKGINTSTAGKIIITPSIDTPATLYYYCTIHPGMGGSATFQ